MLALKPRPQFDPQTRTPPITTSPVVVAVTVVNHNKVEITTDCPAGDERIQDRSTGTGSTKSTGQDSVTVDGFNVGAKYKVRIRCDFQYREPVELTFPATT